MRRLLLGALLTAAFLFFAANASAYQYSITDPYHRLGTTTTAAVQRAVSYQANVQVSQDWRINPVSFIPAGGITIHMLPRAAVEAVCGGADDGCHAYNDVYVSDSQTTDQVEMTISHEVVELEVDRGGTGPEVCDPANIEYQGPGGVWLNEWVAPSYFSRVRSRRGGPRPFVDASEARRS